MTKMIILNHENIFCVLDNQRPVTSRTLIKKARKSNSNDYRLGFIVLPMKRLNVNKITFSSLRNWENMINFPTELATLGKRRFNHHGTANILPEFVWIRSACGVSFCPNGLDNGKFKWLPKLLVFRSLSIAFFPLFLLDFIWRQVRFKNGREWKISSGGGT